jgi:UDP-N-acetylglucosamine--N-acetylmuramyl-(pentapeptide) pyrophosphoryl-undecaprenol N-acetylglucosamine transferase
MKVLVTGGGTGGHLYPALSVMKALRKRGDDHQLCYLGTGDGLEADVIPDYDWIDFKRIKLKGLSRSSLYRFLKGLGLLPLGMIQTLLVMLKFKPDLVYGTGGYTTFPPAFWGIITQTPVVTHELNVKPGVTNRVVARFADKILLSYQETSGYLSSENVEVTGTPVREEIRGPEGTKAPEDFGLKSDCPIILVFGGSLGSRTLVEKVLKEFQKGGNQETLPFQFLVQTGKAEYSRFQEKLKDLETDKIKLVDYIEEMGDVYDFSDFVISRGGAGTMAELIATGTPALIVPWGDAAENHQYHNARYLEEKGGGIMVEEDDWMDFPLLVELKNIFTSEKKLKEMTDSYMDFKNDGGANSVINALKKI